MPFMKSITIYEKGDTRVYINECHAKGRKTKVYAIRKNDRTGLAAYLGGIVFYPRWRQYVFESDEKTRWSSSCMKGIYEFLDVINSKWRKKIRRKR